MRIIKKEKYSLIHSHYARSDLLGAIAAAITGIPLVVHLHSHAKTDTNSFCKSRMNAIIERLCLYKASRVIFVSHKLLHTVHPAEGVLEKVKVIHNGVPIVQPLAVRTLSQTKIVIGAVAFWRPGKGLSILFKAMKELLRRQRSYAKERSKGVSLRLVGGFVSEQYRQHYIKLARDYGISSDISWVGATSEVDDELQKMDVFVLPSRNEGLPMVVLEAMAAGIPVIASNVGGIPEVIRNGTDGILVVPGKPSILADVIEALSSNEEQWHRLRESAYKRQQAHFSESRMAAELAEMYQQLLVTQTS